ncbi:hypothetical protein DL769_004122 [Monosporascus sp. CRB-8-3]|nr:hypothetical protein DL769_004122 [Monosporascus sp. CRB-8-3]
MMIVNVKPYRRGRGPPSPHHITNVTFSESEERMVENVKMQTLKTPSDTNLSAAPRGNNNIHKDVEVAVTYEERSTEGPDRIAIPGIEENPEPRANHYAFARGPTPCKKRMETNPRGPPRSTKILNVSCHRVRCCRSVAARRGGSPLFVGKNDVVTYNTFVMHRPPEFFGNEADDFRRARWAERLPAIRLGVPALRRHAAHMPGSEVRPGRGVLHRRAPDARLLGGREPRPDRAEGTAAALTDAEQRRAVPLDSGRIEVEPMSDSVYSLHLRMLICRFLSV